MSEFEKNFQKAMAAAAPQSRGMGALTEAEQHELVNLYHLARTALAGTGKSGKYQQMLWASREFSKAHPDVSSTTAYKHMDRMGVGEYLRR
jgi:hypothetical protein